MTHPTKADVKVLREVLKLVDQHRLDHLVIGTIQVTKTRHGDPLVTSKKRRGERAPSQEPVVTNDAPESIEDLDREARSILGDALNG